MQTIELYISGKVQGVFFRQSTRKKALELGITGAVCNLDDGRVKLTATGDAAQLQALAAWCETGPEQARVEGVVRKEIPVQVFDSFIIIR